jgi:hypothetical protein
MLQLSLQSGKGNDGKAEMFIDYQSESIGFTVIHENKQFDFSIEKEEWEPFKNFIETEMLSDDKTYERKQVNDNISLATNSLPDDAPLFVDWLDKYYTHAGNDDLYKRKDNGKIELQRKLYNDYKRAYKL